MVRDSNMDIYRKELILMKIIKKTKQFVKKNWKPILIGVGGACGVYGVFKLGVATGMNRLGKNLSDGFGVNLKDGYAYAHTTATLREAFGDEIPEELMNYGFDNLDDKINAAILIQKVES